MIVVTRNPSRSLEVLQILVDALGFRGRFLRGAFVPNIAQSTTVIWHRLRHKLLTGSGVH